MAEKQLLGLIVFKYAPSFGTILVVHAGEQEKDEELKHQIIFELENLGISIFPVNLIGSSSLNQSAAKDAHQITYPLNFTHEMETEITNKILMNRNFVCEFNKEKNFDPLTSDEGPVYSNQKNNERFNSNESSQFIEESKVQKIFNQVEEPEETNQVEGRMNSDSIPVINEFEHDYDFKLCRPERKDCPEDMPSKRPCTEAIISYNKITENNIDENLSQVENYSDRMDLMQSNNLEFSQVFSLETLTEDIIILKNYIETYRNEYQDKIKAQSKFYGNWIKFLVYYHNQEKINNTSIDFYKELGLSWKISDNDDFFSILYSFGDLSFLHYLHEIIQVAKGNIAGHQVENLISGFHDDEKYLKICINMEKYNLKSLLAVYYFDVKEDPGYEPHLKILYYIERTEELYRLEKFEKEYNSHLDYENIFNRKSFSSMILYENQEKLIPIKNIIRKGTSENTKIYFVLACYEKKNLSVVIGKNKKNIIPDFVANGPEKKFGIFTAKIEKGNEFIIVDSSKIWYIIETKNEIYKSKQPVADSYEFIFDREMLNTGYYYIEYDFYFHMYLLAKFILSNEETELVENFFMSLSESLNKVTKSSNQKKVLIEIQNFLEGAAVLKFQSMYSILIFISFIDISQFSFIKESTFHKMSISISEQGTDLMHKLKQRPSFVFAIDGLAKLLFLSRQNFDHSYQLIDLITDINYIDS